MCTAHQTLVEKGKGERRNNRRKVATTTGKKLKSTHTAPHALFPSTLPSTVSLWSKTMFQSPFLRPSDSPSLPVVVQPSPAAGSPARWTPVPTLSKANAALGHQPRQRRRLGGPNSLASRPAPQGVVLIPHATPALPPGANLLQTPIV